MSVVSCHFICKDVRTAMVGPYSTCRALSPSVHDFMCLLKIRYSYFLFRIVKLHLDEFEECGDGQWFFVHGFVSFKRHDSFNFHFRMLQTVLCPALREMYTVLCPALQKMYTVLCPALRKL